MIIEITKCLVSGCPDEGGKHRFEWDQPTGREFMQIQEILGLTPEGWEEQLERMGESVDSKTIEVVLLMLMLSHRREGIKVAFEEVDFRIGDVSFIFDPVAEPEEKPTEPPPISPLPRDPEPATTSGDSTAEGSEPKSSTTEPDSGGTTASP